MNNTIQVVVPKRGDQVSETTLATTDLGNPDALLKPMNILLMILVRCTRVYLQSFLGMLTAGGFGAVGLVVAGEPTAAPINPLAVIQMAAYLSCYPVGFTFLQNALELFTRWDERFPKLRA